MSDAHAIRERDFYGLHRSGWGDRLVPEAFSHPAKLRPDLGQKIISHGLAQGWWHKGGDRVMTQDLHDALQKEIDKGQYRRV